LIREKGLGGISIPEVMAKVGLTRGGFYRHFASKASLTVSAVERTQVMARQVLNHFGSKNPDHETAFEDFARFYLSPDHQTDLATGCPYPALSGDIAREPAGSVVRKRFAEGLEENVLILAKIGDRGERSPSSEELDRAISQYSTLVGATILARATAGSAISERILRVTRERLVSPVSEG
jgi:TetR/AcrR family transcriptional repressor of nem operon